MVFMNRLYSLMGLLIIFVMVESFSVLGFCDDSDVIINEIYYYPDSDLQLEEYVELYNRGNTPVDVSGWSFSQGIQFMFPQGTIVAANGYLVVARDTPTAQKIVQGAVVGNFFGRLADTGETLILYTVKGSIADSVAYQDAPPWPTSPDGFGPSLERISPFAASSDPANWAGAKSGMSGSATKLRTPGQKNSVYSENLPPAVQDVSWNPRCPKPNVNVNVQAHITDEDGVERIELHYQSVSIKKPSQSEQTLVMQRISGLTADGTWSATIPGQADRTLVRFWVKAVDGKGTERIYPAPTESRKTLTYFHYADEAISTIPITLLYDFGNADNPDAFRSDSAFIIRYPGREGWEVYDYVNTTPRTRSGDGHDVRFVKHYEMEDMSSINIAFEAKPRYLLSEWLSYKVFHSLGVIAGKVDHYRLIRNDKDRGYYLMFEQPNKHFIARNGLNNEGNLYKLFWSYDRSTTAQQISSLHEKRTNLSSGKEDIIETIQTLHELTGRSQTLFIESHFAVDEIIHCYIGSQLISDWDGYFNNHYVYNDSEGSGLWYVFPWDKDKTWGDSDGYYDILPYYDFYDFPILFGAYGTPRSGKGNGSWWRPAGYFSGPILANSDLQQQYLYRLEYVARNEFTPERWIPIIDDLEKRLEPEILHRAQVMNENADAGLSQFHTEIESLRRQVINRREFILSETEKVIGPVSVKEWPLY
jgi:hypothetical protein